MRRWIEGCVLKDSTIRLTYFGILLNKAKRSNAEMNASGLFVSEAAYRSAWYSKRREMYRNPKTKYRMKNNIEPIEDIIG